MGRVVSGSGIRLFMVAGVAAALLAGAAPAPLHAQWSGDPNVNTPVCTAGNDQDHPTIIGDGLGGAIITWEDSRAGGSDIYAQRIYNAGTAAWTGNGVAVCSYNYNQNLPRIASDGACGAIIVWTDYRSAGGAQTYAQRINYLGSIQWNANGVPVRAGNGGYQGVVVPDGFGGAFVAWQDSRAGNGDIYAQRLSASGDTLWKKNGVPACTAVNDQTDPAILNDGTGGIFVAWLDTRTDNGDIYAQRLDAWGAPQWASNGVVVCDATNAQTSASMVSDGAGGAIISWNDNRSGTTDIYAQRIDASGIPQWTTNGAAICTAASNQSGRQMIADGAGGAIITWQDARKPNYDTDIYVQRISGAGATLWTPDGVALTVNGDSSTPGIVPDDEGGAIIAWQDNRYGTLTESRVDIYAQRISALGVPQWTADGVAVCTATGDQKFYPVSGGVRPPVMISDGAGGAIITWQDQRSGQWDIYAQNIDASGNLGGTSAAPVVPPSPLRLMVGPPAPNPFWSSVRIACDLRVAGRVRAVVLAPSGARVRTLNDGPQSAGSQVLEWDSRGDDGRLVASGIYFIRLEAGDEVRTVKVIRSR